MEGGSEEESSEGGAGFHGVGVVRGLSGISDGLPKGFGQRLRRSGTGCVEWRL